jgi:hypothetical protein
VRIACLGAVVALVVGLFALGILMEPLAVALGNAGSKRDATTFGTVVVVRGWIEASLSLTRGGVDHVLAEKLSPL